jgi:predicted oxidoreductase
LPESVAAKARARGLLETASVSRLIAREVDLEAPQQNYLELVAKMRACPDEEPMTMDDIQAEVNAVRAERRARESRR